MWVEEKIKFGCIGEVEDIMGVVVFFVFDVSVFIIGFVLLIDGGWIVD